MDKNKGFSLDGKCGHDPLRPGKTHVGREVLNKQAEHANSRKGFVCRKSVFRVSSLLVGSECKQACDVLRMSQARSPPHEALHFFHLRLILVNEVLKKSQVA